MDKQIYLLFSADYELYFGENYFGEREVLIEPTEQILGACQKDGIPMTLFADVASIWRYRSLGVNSDYVGLCEDQMGRAIRQGHDVQLHMHPHWMTSHFDGKRWSMDESKFNLSDLGYGQRKDQDLESGDEIIRRGKEYLENLLLPSNPSYSCVAFRAGGYGVQPGDKELIRALLSEGFKIDSSIVPGMVFQSNVNRIDFRRIPSRLNYWMGSRYGISREEGQGLFEIPLAAYPESVCETFGHHLSFLRTKGIPLKRKALGSNAQNSPRGRGIQRVSPFGLMASRILGRSLFLLEFSGPKVDVRRLSKGTRKLINRHLEEAPLYLSPSCHPKNVFPSTIDALREFWRDMRSFYGHRVKAITFQEAARGLGPFNPVSVSESLEGVSNPEEQSPKRSMN